MGIKQLMYYIQMLKLISILMSKQQAIYYNSRCLHRTGFDCEYLLNAKCEVFYDSQSNNSTPYTAASTRAIIEFAM